MAKVDASGITGFLKRAAVNLMLIAAFYFVAVALTRPLLAQREASAAAGLVKEYKWVQAEDRFRKAIAIDPSNAIYYAKLGDFIFAQSSYSGYREPAVREAEKLYRRAIELDPRNAEYWFRLGRAKIARKEYEKAFRYFRAAVNNDPYGYYINYGIGAAGLGVWNNIGGPDRNFIIGRLNIALRAHPYDSNAIYSLAWRARKDFRLLEAMAPATYEGQSGLLNFLISDNLWQFRKGQADKVSRYLTVTPEAARAVEEAKMKRLKDIKDAYSRRGEKKPLVARSDWSGRTADGKNEFKDGGMYWSGGMDAAVDMPAGNVIIKIRARGQPADKVYPYMIVGLDDEEIGEAFVDSEEWKEFLFTASGDGGVKVLSVRFANDACSGKEDRNLYIDRAEIVKDGG